MSTFMLYALLYKNAAGNTSKQTVLYEIRNRMGKPPTLKELLAGRSESMGQMLYEVVRAGFCVDNNPKMPTPGDISKLTEEHYSCLEPTSWGVVGLKSKLPKPIRYILKSRDTKHPNLLIDGTFRLEVVPFDGGKFNAPRAITPEELATISELDIASLMGVYSVEGQQDAKAKSVHMNNIDMTRKLHFEIPMDLPSSRKNWFKTALYSMSAGGPAAGPPFKRLVGDAKSNRVKLRKILESMGVSLENVHDNTDILITKIQEFMEKHLQPIYNKMAKEVFGVRSTEHIGLPVNSNTSGHYRNSQVSHSVSDQLYAHMLDAVRKKFPNHRKALIGYIADLAYVDFLLQVRARGCTDEQASGPMGLYCNSAYSTLMVNCLSQSDWDKVDAWMKSKEQAAEKIRAFYPTRRDDLDILEATTEAEEKQQQMRAAEASL